MQALDGRQSDIRLQQLVCYVQTTVKHAAALDVMPSMTHVSFVLCGLLFL